MDLDELRDNIWAYLYHAQGRRTIDEIAAFADCEVSIIIVAVDHEWFTVENGQVSIAYS